MNYVTIISIVVLVMILVGGGVWWFFFRETEEDNIDGNLDGSNIMGAPLKQLGESCNIDTECDTGFLCFSGDMTCQPELLVTRYNNYNVVFEWSFDAKDNLADTSGKSTFVPYSEDLSVTTIPIDQVVTQNDMNIDIINSSNIIGAPLNSFTLPNMSQTWIVKLRILDSTYLTDHSIDVTTVDNIDPFGVSMTVSAAEDEIFVSFVETTNSQDTLQVNPILLTNISANIDLQNDISIVYVWDSNIETSTVYVNGTSIVDERVGYVERVGNNGQLTNVSDEKKATGIMYGTNPKLVLSGGTDVRFDHVALLNKALSRDDVLTYLSSL